MAQEGNAQGLYTVYGLRFTAYGRRDLEGLKRSEETQETVEKCTSLIPFGRMPLGKVEKNERALLYAPCSMPSIPKSNAKSISIKKM